MSEPTPKRPDPTRPAVQQPAKDGAGDPGRQAIGTVGQGRSGTAEIVAGDLQIVSRAGTPAAPGRRTAQSGPRGDGRCAASRHVARRPRGAAGKAAGTADRTRCLADPHARAVEFLRRRVRIPPRWEQWLADPQRRNNVGVGVSIAIHVAIVVLLALVLRAPARTPAAEPIHARAVQPAAGEAAARKAGACRAIARTRGAAGHRRGAGDRGAGAARGCAI